MSSWLSFWPNLVASWPTLTVNSIALGGLLFLLSAGFSLIFGLMRIPNLLHGSFFMLGAYFGVSFLAAGTNFWLAALLSAAAMGVIGGLIERFLLRRLAGQELAQVLLTLGFAFIIADVCLMVWTGDPWQPPTPSHLQGAVQITGLFFPLFRLAIVGVAIVVAIALWLMVDWTRLGAMIRAGVDDASIARVCGIKVSQLFTLVFALGAALAAFAGVMGAPYLSVYPGLDFEMLPLALIVVILGGTGSLLGALVGSFLIGFLYNFGQAIFPDLAYVILFLPMLLVLVLRPQGLFGRVIA
jgi:branched-chain amino acid transport system permease protein